MRADARGYPLWPRAPKLYSRAGYRSARPIPPSLISGLRHAAELAQGPLKACLTGRRQREEIEAPNAYGFGASAFRALTPLEKHQRQKLGRAEIKELQREVEARRRREDEHMMTKKFGRHLYQTDDKRLMVALSPQESRTLDIALKQGKISYEEVTALKAQKEKCDG